VNASDYLLQDAKFSGRYQLHSLAQDGVGYSVQVPAFQTGVLLPSSLLFEGFDVRMIMFMDQGGSVLRRWKQYARLKRYLYQSTRRHAPEYLYYQRRRYEIYIELLLNTGGK
jgi:hypothetical protein